LNTYNVNDQNFINSEIYQKFLSENTSRGYLNIRAYAANQAIPISGLRVVVSTIIDNNKVIFFEGSTNSSGIIGGISLPAPKLDPNNLDAPNKTTYEIQATYTPDNITQIYKVNMYENVSVIQNINIVPEGGL
jgi:hypothetical protein